MVEIIHLVLDVSPPCWNLVSVQHFRDVMSLQMMKVNIGFGLPFRDKFFFE